MQYSCVKTAESTATVHCHYKLYHHHVDAQIPRTRRIDQADDFDQRTITFPLYVDGAATSSLVPQSPGPDAAGKSTTPNLNSN